MPGIYSFSPKITTIDNPSPFFKFWIVKLVQFLCLCDSVDWDYIYVHLALCICDAISRLWAGLWCIPIIIDKGHMRSRETFMFNLALLLFWNLCRVIATLLCTSSLLFCTKFLEQCIILCSECNNGPKVHSFFLYCPWFTYLFKINKYVSIYISSQCSCCVLWLFKNVISEPDACLKSTIWIMFANRSVILACL